MKTLNIQNSKYGFQYEEGKEFNYTITRCGENVTKDLNYNIVSDMFYNLLSNAEQLESIKSNLTRIAEEGISAGTLQTEYFKRGIETALELINTVTNPDNEIRPEELSAQDWYERATGKAETVINSKKPWIAPEIETLKISETD